MTERKNGWSAYHRRNRQDAADQAAIVAGRIADLGGRQPTQNELTSFEVEAALLVHSRRQQRRGQFQKAVETLDQLARAHRAFRDDFGPPAAAETTGFPEIMPIGVKP